MPEVTRLERKRKPKNVAIIREEECSGCEVCIFFCPVKECIIKISGERFESVNSVCKVIIEKCIGCALCQKYCPWEVIDMVPLEKATGVVL